MRRRAWLGLTALAAVFSLFLGGALPGRAAEAKFKDSPADSHWAGQSLGTLKENQMLFGYPDGKFRGDQAATRYELAAALSRLHALIQSAQKNADAQRQAVLDQMAAEVLALQKSLSELGERVAKAEESIPVNAASKDELAAVEKAVKELAAQADFTARQVKKLARRMLDLASESEVQTLRGQLQEVLALNDGVKRLGDRLAEQEQAIGRLDGRVNQVAADVAAQKTATDAKDAELQLAIAQLRKQLGERATAGDLAQLKERLSSLEASLAGLSVAASAADKDRGEAQETMKELGSHVNKVAGDLSALRTATENLRTQFAGHAGGGAEELGQLRERLSALEASLAGVSATVAEADKDRAAAQEAVKDLSVRVNQLAADLAALKTASEDLRGQLANHPHAADPELGGLKARQAALETALASVSATAAAADRERGLVQAEVEQLGGQVTKIAADLAALTTTSEALRRQLADHLAAGAGDLDQIKERLAALEASLAAVTATATAADKNHTEAQAAMQQLGGKVEQVAADLAALRTASEGRLAELKAANDARLAELSAAVAELRLEVANRPTTSELGQLKERQAALESSLAKVSVAAEAADKDRSEVQETMKELGAHVKAVASDLAALKSASQELQTKLTRPAGAASAETSELSSLKERLLALEASLAGVSATVAEADKDRSLAQAAVKDLSGQVNQIAADLAALKTASDDLRGRLDTHLNTTDPELNQLKERQATIEAALAGVCTTAAEADKERGVVQAAVEQLGGQVSRIAADLATLTTTSEELRRQLTDHLTAGAGDLDQVKARLAALEAALSSVAATAASADKDRTEAQAAMQQLGGKVEQVAADLAALRAANEGQLAAVKAESEARLAELKASSDTRFAELTSALAELRREVGTRPTSSELSQLKERQAALEASLAKLSVAAEAADKDRGAVQETMKELGAHVKTVASDLAALKTASAELQTKLTQPAGAAGPEASELDGLKDRLLALEASLAGVSATVAEADKDRSLAQGAVKDLSGQVNQIAAELASLKTASEDLRNRLDKHLTTTDPELNQLKERQATLEAALASVCATAAEADQERGVVQAAVDQLGTQVARIAADLAGLRTTSEELRRQLMDHLATGAGDLNQVKERLAALEASLSSVTVAAAAADQDRTEAQAAMQQLGGKVEQVAADLAALKMASEAKVAQLRLASAAKDAELQAALDDLRQRLAGHIGAADTDLGQMKARLAALEAALAGVGVTAEAADKGRSAAQEAMRSLGSQVETIAADLASLKNTSDELHRELTNRPASDENTVNQLKERLAELESALASVTATASAAEKERTVAQVAMDNLSGQVNRIAADLAALKAAAEDLRRTIGAIPDNGQTDLTQLKERLTALELSLASVSATASAADHGRLAVEVAMKDLSDQVNRMAVELAALKLASEDLRRQLSEGTAIAEAGLSQLKERLVALETSLATATATAAAADRARIAAEEAMAKLAEQVNQLSARLAQQDKDRQAAEEELWTVTKELGGKVDRVQDRLGDLVKAEAGLRQLTERIGSLETQVAESAAGSVKEARLKSEVDRLETQLAALQADFARELASLKLSERDRAAAQDELWLMIKELGGKLDQLRKIQESTGVQASRTATELAEHKDDSDAWKEQLKTDQASLDGRLGQAVTELKGSDQALGLRDQELQAQDQKSVAADQELQKADAALSGELDALQQTTAAQAAELRKADEGLETRVITLEGKAEAQAKETEALKGDLQETRQTVDDLRIRVANLEEETNKLKTNFRRITWLIALGAIAVAAF